LYPSEEGGGEWHLVSSGPFTTGQWNELESFIFVQQVDLQARRDWLSAALARNGIFNTEYDENNFPTTYDAQSGSGGFTCIPDSSYGGKLLTAYRALGGVPETDMLLRTTDMPIFLTGGSQTQTGEGAQKTGYSDMYSNGRRERGGMRFDRDLGLLVEAVKAPFLEIIKQKRERLEFKIKRALDYSDQIQREIDQLDKLLAPDGVLALLGRVQSAITQPGQFGVIKNDNDKFGLNIGRVGDLAFDDSVDQADSEEERVPQ